jgi:glycosyltransferase involved in cell wall biosynthesis
MIIDRDIVIVGQQPWDVEIGSNCKNIALEMSRKNRVLYVNSPLDRISSLRDKDEKTKKRLAVIAGKGKGLVKVQDNLWNLYPDCLVESVNWISVDFLFTAINKSNNKKFATSIKKAMEELRFSNVILFNDNEIMKCFYLVELLKPSLSVYYSRDYILATPYWKKHGNKLEPAIIAKNDVCVANSSYLAAYCGQYNHNSHDVGQGCELEAFQKETFDTPEELRHLSRPVIGYVGALLGMRLDVNILVHVAKQHPEWTVVLVGPEDEAFQNSELHQFKNVLFTGPKSADLLPQYIHAFDVCINPQVANLLTIGNYPRKVDEYLAMGKPVVATRTTAMELFEDHVYLAATKEDYCFLIEKALAEDSDILKGQRKEFAAAHTWENSVAQIYTAMEKTEASLNKPFSIKKEAKAISIATEAYDDK